MIRALATYHRKRRLVEALSTLAIVVMPFLNIFRLDIPTLRFYFFNKVLWVDEFYLLFLALMLLLWIIVMFSMLYGRIWCGWMCPQTVVSELVRWWEGKMKRLFRVPRSGGPLWRRAASSGAVAAGTGAVALLIGFNLVAYFVDPVSMIRDIASGTLGAVTWGIIAGIALLVLVDGLFWREKFCAKACPYGMMQMLVTDARTQIVRYKTEADEECIECKACLRVCSMGIDIRESPYQSECIQCGECVDACAQILGRMNRPTLIRFSWGTRETSGGLAAKLGFVDARRWIMLALTLAYTAVLVVLVDIRQPVSLSVSGDRSTLFRRGEDGLIYNDYTMNVSNRSMTDGRFSLECIGAPAAPGCTLHVGTNPVPLKSREARTIRFSISTAGGNFHPGPNRLMLKAMNVADTAVAATTEAVFFMPEPAGGI
ncbi:MAG TPA: 4Fe-4S dicluster domain-containing protein [Bacteroidota bacterium]|nr:4Fe-4S dicluster domain-containing protein [Bacteroidota bacterium]